MRNKFSDIVEKGRLLKGYYASRPGDTFGAFVLRHRNLVPLKVIAVADGDGWDHVSVSHGKRCPTWDEMCWVKGLFFEPTECVIQYHPSEDRYVNIHNHCLHLWRPVGVDVPMPRRLSARCRLR